MTTTLAIGVAGDHDSPMTPRKPRKIRLLAAARPAILQLGLGLFCIVVVVGCDKAASPTGTEERCADPEAERCAVVDGADVPQTCEFGRWAAHPACGFNKKCALVDGVGVACVGESGDGLPRPCSEVPTLQCDDGNHCTLDTCTTLGCAHMPVASVGRCDDGNSCSVSDLCDGKAGVCAGTERSCDDGNPCTKDSCVPDSGCKATAIVDCSLCEPPGPDSAENDEGAVTWQLLRIRRLPLAQSCDLDHDGKPDHAAFSGGPTSKPPATSWIADGKDPAAVAWLGDVWRWRPAGGDKDGDKAGDKGGDKDGDKAGDKGVIDRLWSLNEGCAAPVATECTATVSGDSYVRKAGGGTCAALRSSSAQQSVNNGNFELSSSTDTGGSTAEEQVWPIGQRCLQTPTAAPALLRRVHARVTSVAGTQADGNLVTIRLCGALDSAAFTALLKAIYDPTCLPVSTSGVWLAAFSTFPMTQDIDTDGDGFTDATSFAWQIEARRIGFGGAK